jgi:hypothetical protein
MIFRVVSADNGDNLHLTLRSRQRLQAVEAFWPFFSAGIVFENTNWNIKDKVWRPR